MAALAATIPTNTGTVVTGAGVAATDTIAAALLGKHGAVLEIINAGVGADAITISDAGLTPAGNSPGTIAASVTNGTNKVFTIRREQVNQATQLVTITHGQPTGVTYKLYPI